jgi:chromosome segregation ATPase
MITKEELLVALEGSSRNLYKSNEVFGLALKGLESESTVKRLIQARDQWRKKYDDLADELDDKIIALEDKLRDTVTLKYHDELVNSANRRIISLRDERDAFHRLVGELRTEKSCMHVDLENMCKELGVLKGEIDELGSKDDDWRLSVSYYMNLAAVWEKQAKELKVKVEAFEAFFTGKD